MARKLVLCIALTLFGQCALAQATLKGVKPAALKPSEIPPHPANKSTYLTVMEVFYPNSRTDFLLSTLPQSASSELRKNSTGTSSPCGLTDGTTPLETESASPESEAVRDKIKLQA